MKHLIQMIAFLSLALCMGCSSTVLRSNTARGPVFSEHVRTPFYSRTFVDQNFATHYDRCREHRGQQNAAQGYNTLVDDQATCFGQSEYGQPMQSSFPPGSPLFGAYGGFGYGGFAPGGFIRPTQALPVAVPGYMPQGQQQVVPQPPVVPNSGGPYVPVGQYNADQRAIIQRIETTR